ncbi:MAG: winged helix-turn-helix domain-containing protein [Blastocatellia bacterium]
MEQPPLYQFNQYQLDPAQKILLRDGARVPLNPKGFQMLLVLVEAEGRVVGKDDLMARVWPDVTIEESNLTKNMSQLRRILTNGHGGAELIETIPKVGYRLAVPVRAMKPEPEPVSLPEPRLAGRRWRWAVAAMTGLLVAAAIYLAWPRPSVIKSLAVLPFKSLDQKPEDETLGLRLADALILRAGGLREVVIRPLTSVRKYAGQDFDPVIVGRELRTDAVLTGMFQHADGRTRLTAQLLRTSDGRQLWSGTFDEKSDDALLAQDTLAGQVGAALAPRLSGQELRKTIDLDPHFANAHAKLSFIYQAQGRQAEFAEEQALDYELSGDSDGAAAIRAAYARGGWQGLAEFEIQQLLQEARRTYVNPKEFVLAYLRLGDKERALDWLEKAYAEHSEAVLYSKVDPRYDSLRAAPRFKDLLQRMRLDK